MLGLVSLFTARAYVGWNIGANDASICIGTTVGSGLLSYRRSILLVGTFVVVGALLQGQHVIHTVGKGIVTIQLPVPAVLAALISAGLFVTAATFFKLPVSTSQSIVGAVVGVGLVKGRRAIRKRRIYGIAVGWIATPTSAGIFSFLLYRLISVVL
jgi:PiT family inorganic phosphate transporter